VIENNVIKPPITPILKGKQTQNGGILKDSYLIPNSNENNSVNKKKRTYTN